MMQINKEFLTFALSTPEQFHNMYLKEDSHPIVLVQK